jgi:hypothetical protein
MKYKLITLLILLNLTGCSKREMKEITFKIPTYGNAWVNNIEHNRKIITKEGIKNWVSEKDIINCFFKNHQKTKVKIGVELKVSQKAKLRFKLGKINKSYNFENKEYKSFELFEANLDEIQYNKLNIMALSFEGDYIAEIKNILIYDGNKTNKLTYVKEDFYWGRRGPSVHLNYRIPKEAKKIKYYYSEIQVPKGNDVMGSYFMANGFGQGYFGMQVNSPNERRILFSVWSPHVTDDPKSIPEHKKIKLQKKGKDVYTGKFGGEGSGGQSFYRYMWESGKTYQFLLNGEPSGQNTTTFTAYFKEKDEKKWKLIASFKRPLTNTYLTRFHSFLENFYTPMGQFTRKGYYKNQWVCDIDNKWYKIEKAIFTADNTARKGSRVDYAGGVEDGKFFMKNCGFFPETIKINSVFKNSNNNTPPNIDLIKNL